MTSREIQALAKEIVEEQMKYDVVGIEEAAQILGVSPATVSRKISDIPHGRFGGGKLRFRKADLVKLMMR